MHTTGLIILELNPSEDSGMGRGRSGGWGGVGWGGGVDVGANGTQFPRWRNKREADVWCLGFRACLFVCLFVCVCLFCFILTPNSLSVCCDGVLVNIHTHTHTDISRDR